MNAETFTRALHARRVGDYWMARCVGHDDWNPRIERPEHRTCNRRAANQLKTSREW